MSDDEKLEIFDYGFSLMSEEEVKKAEKDLIDEQKDQLTETQRKLLGLKAMIWPLFERLRQDPLKPYLFWPTRAEKISDLMNRAIKFIEEEK